MKDKFIVPTILAGFLVSFLAVFLGGMKFGAEKSLGGRQETDLVSTGKISAQRYHISSDNYRDATTTPVSVINPFTASAVLEFSAFNQTGAATSSHTLTCGTSSTAFATPSTKLVNVSVPTSTARLIVPGITGVEGLLTSGANTFPRIIVESGDYLVCKITSWSSGAFTNAVNTYAGKYYLRWLKLN